MHEKLLRKLSVAVIGAFILLGGHFSAAIDYPYEIGVEAKVDFANGEPANDMAGMGIVGRFALTDRWWLGTSIDLLEYDFEEPVKIIGMEQDALQASKAIDSTVTANNFGIRLERRYGTGRMGSNWFWDAGLGLGVLSVADVSGPAAGGGRFNLTSDVGTEVLILGGLGYRHAFGERWILAQRIGVTQHRTNWEVRDSVSGRSGQVDDYTTIGLSVGVDYRF